MADAVAMTAKMHHMRDAMRSLWGEQYSAKIAPWQDAIAQVAEGKKISTLQAAIQMAKVTDNEHAVILVMAAAVETIEPSIVAGGSTAA